MASVKEFCVIECMSAHGHGIKFLQAGESCANPATDVNQSVKAGGVCVEHSIV